MQRWVLPLPCQPWKRTRAYFDGGRREQRASIGWWLQASLDEVDVDTPDWITVASVGIPLGGEQFRMQSSLLRVKLLRLRSCLRGGPC